MEHIIKLGDMLVKHKEELVRWKGSIGPKIEENVITNITKGEGYAVRPFMNGRFAVSMEVFLLLWT